MDILNDVGYEKMTFENYDFTDFWDDIDYSLNEYVEEYPSDEMIESVEKELGYKLPESYICLLYTSQIHWQQELLMNLKKV